MSFTQNRRGDFQGIKTRELILQDPSGSFPPLNSILVVGDTKGGITTTQNLTIPQAAIELQELTTASDSTGRYITLKNGGLDFRNKAGNITNPGEFSINKDPVDGNFHITTTSVGKVNMTIDETGSMVLSGFSTQYNAAIPTASDVTIGGNLYIGGVGSDPQRTGAVSMQTMVLQDRANNADTFMWAGNNSLLWQSSVDTPVDLLGWSSLLDPTDDLTPIDPNDFGNTTVIAEKVNAIINLLSQRNILIKSIYVSRPIQFQTDPTMNIGSQVFSISTPYTYSDISGLVAVLSDLGLPVSFNTRFNKVFLNVQSPITISDGGRKGSAQRLMNHLGLYSIVVPASGSLTFYRPEYGSMIDPSGLGQISVLANPLLLENPPTGSRYAVISWTNNVSDPDGQLRFFGVYKNGDSVDIVPRGVNTNRTYTFYGLSPQTQYSYSVTSIGLYDEGAIGDVYTFTTRPDSVVPTPTGIRLTQYLPTASITQVVPFTPSTYGDATGVILDSSGVADPSCHVIPYDIMVYQSYLYSSSFTLTFPDDYTNVYIGFYAPDGGTVDAYRLRINGITSDNGIGVWEQQEVFGAGVAQYFKIPNLAAGVSYQASLVAMNAFTQSYPYSLGIFLVQVQPDFDTSLVDVYRFFSPTLDTYLRTPLLSFCSLPVV